MENTNTARATFIAPNCQFPPHGSTGIVWTASGYADPESAEYGAFLFQPDGEEDAYYCERADLAMVSA